MWKWEADGQAKAVIAIFHGAYENHRWYAWLIEKLRLEGFHIVMGDLPNHGVMQGLLESMMKTSNCTISIQET